MRREKEPYWQETSSDGFNTNSEPAGSIHIDFLARTVGHSLVTPSRTTISSSVVMAQTAAPGQHTALKRPSTVVQVELGAGRGG
jgi:hypothetical protein